MDTLAQLVVIPSESTHEGDIARFIKQWLDECGIKTYQQAKTLLLNKKECIL